MLAMCKVLITVPRTQATQHKCQKLLVFSTEPSRVVPASLNEFIFVKCLAQDLAHSKDHLHIC